MNPNDISKFIEKARKDKGLTQRQLAKELGVSNTAISKWENGNNLPDISMLEPLSEVLEIDILDLIKAQNNTHEENSKKKPTKAKKERIKRRILTITIIILSIISTHYITSRSYRKSIKRIEDSTVEVYEIKSKDDSYYIEGYLIFNDKESILVINQLEYQGDGQGTKEFSNIINIDLRFKLFNEIIGNFNLNKNKNTNINELLNDFRVIHKSKDKEFNKKYENSKKELILNITYKNDERTKINVDLDLKRVF